MDSDTIPRRKVFSSLPRLPFDVFLSYRVPEHSRCSFTDHLHSRLTQKGIKTFFDDGDDVPMRGEKIAPSVLRAIEYSGVSIIIFSENYASSEWCLDELVKILQCKESRQQMVCPIFYYVDPTEVRTQLSSFGEAFAKHECQFNDDMEKLQTWRNALSEAANLSGWHFRGGNESKFIQHIVEQLSEKLLDYSLNVAEHPVGIKSRVQELDELLGVGMNDVRMVGIWGISGIGKTTIAKAIYNSIAHEFDSSCFLANVGEKSMPKGGLVLVQSELLYKTLGLRDIKLTSVDEGISVIKGLRHKRVLLILDDVDHLEQLDKLAGSADWFGLGSRIIITTRNKHLLTVHQINRIYKVKELDPDEALELFSWHAIGGNTVPNDYEKFAATAVYHCHNIPLAVVVLGSHLSSRSIDEWEFVVEAYRKIPDLNILKNFRRSFDSLEDQAKHLFLDIACFFNGRDTNTVLKILEDSDLFSQHQIHVLVEHALIEIDENRIRMNELVELMGKEIVRQESPIEPGRRSRLWFHDDVYNVLEENTGSSEVRSILVKLPEPREICLSAESFSKMKNLRLFINCNARFSGDYIDDHISRKLRFVNWPELQSSALKSLPRSGISRLAEQFEASSEWIFLFTSLCLEMLSAVFDQLSSPSKPHFALYGMLLAIVAVLTCVLELIYKGIKKRVVWMTWGMLWWFYYPPPRKMLFGTLPDMYGLIGGISQCASSAVDYVCALRHIDNPIKISFLPPTFLICVVVSKLIGNGSYTRFESTIEIPPSPPKQKNKIEKEKADRNFELTSIIIDESHSAGSRRWERLRSRRG